MMAHNHGAILSPLISLSAQNKTEQNQNLKALIAEDNDVNRMIITGILSKLNIPYDVAQNGYEAVSLYSNAPQTYDIILMDCEMPVLDGYSATQQIRKREQEAHINPTPIVALTAHIEATHRQMATDSGMNHFISKPLTVNKIRDVFEFTGIELET